MAQPARSCVEDARALLEQAKGLRGIDRRSPEAFHIDRDALVRGLDRHVKRLELELSPCSLDGPSPYRPERMSLNAGTIVVRRRSVQVEIRRRIIVKRLPACERS